MCKYPLCNDLTLTMGHMPVHNDYLHFHDMYIFRYSMECLLAFIEFTQYQEEVIKRYKQLQSAPSTTADPEIITNLDDTQEFDENKVDIINFPDNIPKSAILSGPIQFEMASNEKENGSGVNEKSDTLDDMFDLKLRAYKLYQKYVEDGVEFAINVSGKQRDDIVDIVDDFSTFTMMDMSHQELVMLFDEVKKEMLMLLDISFMRFKTSPEWNEIDVDSPRFRSYSNRQD